MNTIEYLKCGDADEMLDKLSPRYPLWAADPSAWVYRGQSRKSWQLLPKAYRSGSDQYTACAVECDLAGMAPWVAYESAQNALLDRFAEALDRAGLSRPAPQAKLFYGPAEYTYGGEPGPDSYPTIALMQHHGLPTPLLDWTRQGRFGAYFAAAGAAEDVSRGVTSNEPLVVWALRADFLERILPGRVPNSEVELRVLRAPAATNPNLHAQQGLFTWCRGDEEAHLKTVDGVMGDALKDPASLPKSIAGVGPPLMWCLELERHHAPKLLRLLSYEGVHGSTMFPGVDGVVRSMCEQAWWDARPQRRGRR